jgi:hypothetical protein
LLIRRRQEQKKGNSKDEEQIQGSFTAFRKTTKNKGNGKKNTGILSFAQNDDVKLGGCTFEGCMLSSGDEEEFAGGFAGFEVTVGVSGVGEGVDVFHAEFEGAVCYAVEDVFGAR